MPPPASKHWPLSQDFNESIQDPFHAFADAELRSGQVTCNALGMPAPRSGNFADVYEVACPLTNSRWAVKCFTRQVPNLADRYSAIAAHLDKVQLPFTAPFAFLDRGIAVQGRWYPVIKMQWIKGLHLHEFVAENVAKPKTLHSLSAMFLKLGQRLREAGVAHGDLQHGNILLIPGSRSSSLALMLVDYDGLYVPSLARWAATEYGHSAYQHPKRAATRPFNPELDRFSLLVLLCTLGALTIGGKALWNRFHTGENLLFQGQDFIDPGRSALFKELWPMSGGRLRALLGFLVLSCAGPIEAVPHVCDIVEQGRMLSQREEQRVDAILGISPKPVAKTKTKAAALLPDWLDDVRKMESGRGRK